MSTSTDLADNLRVSIDHAVDAYCESIGTSVTKAKGDGFALWCLKELFGLEHEQAVDAIEVGGAFDNSLDGFFDDNDNLLVLQAKYNSHSWAEAAKFQADMDRLATDEPKTAKLPVRLAAAKLRTAHQRSDPVRYYYITNQQFSGDDLAKLHGLTIRNQPITAWDLDGLAQEIVDRSAFRPAAQRSQKVALRCSAPPLRVEGSLVAPVGLIEFARFVENGRDWLFSSNVRNYLPRTAVNRGIRDTITKSPEKFWRYNNGVTIVCDSWQERSPQEFVLLSPQVVNGCQTSLSIADVIGTLDFEQQRAVEGDVLVRVIQEESDDDRIAITKFTNKQNAVKNKDFFSLEDFHRTLRARFQPLGYFYEIQSGSYDVLRDSQKAALKGDERFNYLGWVRRDFRIPAIEAAKCYAAAFLGEVSVCYANPGDVAPGGSAYEKNLPARFTR